MKRSIFVLAIVAILTATSNTFANLIDGLIANYSFSGNANDVSGNDHHGTVYGATLTIDRFGNTNRAYSFNGISDYISVPYTDAFQLPVYTFSAWINPSVNLSTLDSYIVCRSEDSTTDRAAFALGVISESNPWGDGVIVLYEDNSDVDYVYDTGYYPSLNTSSLNTWTHLAATRLPDGQLNIYCNGNLLGHWDSTPVPATICFQELTIGAYWRNPEGISNFFPGIIDDVRIYNRALSCDEIHELYVVPIPSAVFLGSIGLFFAGLKLRKQKET